MGLDNLDQQGRDSLAQLYGPGGKLSGMPGANDVYNQLVAQQKQQTNVPFVQSPYYDPNAFNFGGAPGLAQQWSQFGMDQMGRANGMQDYYNNQSKQGAFWGQQSRGEQQGSIDLARDAAMGRAPSQAALLMQQGLNNAAAQQNSQAASARGAAALANAQGNAGANIAALQNQTFNQAGQLRAQEMAQARGQYGELAAGMRGQDNAYAGGMGGLGAQYGQIGQGYFGQSAGIVGQQGDAQRQGQGLLAGDWNAQRQRDENHYQYETGRKDAEYDKNMAAVGDAAKGGYGLVTGAINKPPAPSGGGMQPSAGQWETADNSRYRWT